MNEHNGEPQEECERRRGNGPSKSCTSRPPSTEQMSETEVAP